MVLLLVVQVVILLPVLVIVLVLVQVLVGTVQAYAMMADVVADVVGIVFVDAVFLRNVYRQSAPLGGPLWPAPRWLPRHTSLYSRGPAPRRIRALP